METQQNNTQQLNDEFTRIFDAYRVKINEITRHTQRNLLHDSELQDFIFSPDPEKSVNIYPALPAGPEKPPPSVNPPAKVEVRIIKESNEIVNQAKHKAQEIITEAEENARKEAKKRTQSQVDKILIRAQKEAQNIVNGASESVEKERKEAAALLKRETERLITEITEKCHKEARAEAARILAGAQEKAAKMINDIVTSSEGIGRQLHQILERAAQATAEYEAKIQSETHELDGTISAARDSLLQITASTGEEKPMAQPPAKKKEHKNSPTLAVHLLGNKSDSTPNDPQLFSGQVEMKSITSSLDYQYLKNLKNYLVHIPSIKYLQESASEREISLLFDVREPLPLLDILNNFPLVEEVIAETDDDICLIFKNNE